MPETNKINLKLPLTLLAGSFSILLVLAGLTNPQDDITAIPLFFLLLWLVMFSFIWSVLAIFKRRLESKHKTWIGLIVTFIVLFLMLKSTGEIRPVDLLVLLLLASGLSLYVNRRF